MKFLIHRLSEILILCVLTNGIKSDRIYIKGKRALRGADSMIITGAICDKCSKAQYWRTHLGKGDVVKWLREDGWSVGTMNKTTHEQRTLCPSCRGTKPKK